MPTTTPVKRKRRKANKSAAIRDYFKTNPTAGPTEVVAALAEKNMKVAPTLVSNVKSRMLNGGAPTGKPGRRGRPARSSNGDAAFTISLLMEAKRLAQQAGSVEAAREALDVISKLQ